MEKHLSNDNDSSWSTGEAKCLCCGHECVIAYPTGLVWFECPKCGTEKMTTKYTIEPSNALQWMCNCGSGLFYITSLAIRCKICGAIQYPFDDYHIKVDIPCTVSSTFGQQNAVKRKLTAFVSVVVIVYLALRHVIFPP